MIPPEIEQEVKKRGLSAVLDEIKYREELCRQAMLDWKKIRQALEARIQSPIDELSEIAEEAWRNAVN